MRERELALWALDEAKRQGADQVEVYVGQGKSLKVEVSDGELEGLERADSRGAGIRVISGQRLGFAYTNTFTQDGMRRAVEAALANSRLLPPDPFHDLPEPGEPAAMEIFDPQIEKIPVEEKIEKARAMEAAAKAQDSRIRAVRKASYQDAEGEVLLLNSKGVDQSYRSSYASVSLMALAEQDGKTETGWAYDVSRRVEKLNPEEIGVEAGQRAVSMLGAREVAGGRLTVIFQNLVAAEFVDLLGGILAADSVQKGKSLFAGKVGESVAASILEMVDDGRYPQGIGSFPVDDEGVPGQETVLIQGGVLRSFLHNAYTAKKAGEHSTGNGIRGSFKGLPEVQASNLFIRGGQKTLQEMEKGVEKGLLITEVMGVHTADPISGDFSLGASGHWIENGERKFPVRGIAIAGNLIELLKSIEEIGGDLRFLGRTGSPSLRIRQISVSGE